MCARGVQDIEAVKASIAEARALNAKAEQESLATMSRCVFFKGGGALGGLTRVSLLVVTAAAVVVLCAVGGRDRGVPTHPLPLRM